MKKTKDVTEKNKNSSHKSRCEIKQMNLTNSEKGCTISIK